MKLKKTIHKSRLLAFKDNMILVLEKAGSNKQYTLAGGVKKKNETDYECLIREVKEEIGVLLNKEELQYFISKQAKSKDNKELHKHYFVTTKNITSVALSEVDKFKDILWVPMDQALKYLDKEDKNAVAKYTKQNKQNTN